MVSAGLNGIGRFGLHLLRAWLDRPDGPLRIVAINDAHYSLEAAVALLRGDAKVSFADCAVDAEAGQLVLRRAGRAPLRLDYSHGPAGRAPWLGRPRWWLECSGAHPTARECRAFLAGATRRVLIAATCWDAEQTLVYGYNEDTLDPAATLLSYGSCTVNAFVPLAAWLHERYGVEEAAVNVIHSVAPHRLAAQRQPERRPCTLEGMAPRLLPWLAAERLWVDYALVPSTGVSLIDFRFRLARPEPLAATLEALGAACRDGALKGLYQVDEADEGAQACAMRPESAILLRPRARMGGATLALPAYFDNENSATRYLDLLLALSARVD